MPQAVSKDELQLACEKTVAAGIIQWDTRAAVDKSSAGSRDVLMLLSVASREGGGGQASVSERDPSKLESVTIV